MGKKERIAELDALRGLAFLAVVYQHIAGIYIRRPDMTMQEGMMFGMAFNLMKFAVPMFIFISGIALFYNYYGKVNYASFIKKRFVDIFIPYVLWTVVYYWYIYHAQIDVFSASWLKAVGRELIIPVTGYHLWYIIMIFQYYLLFPVILFLFKWFTEKLSTITVLIGTGLIYIWLMWLSSHYLMKPHEFPYLLEKLVKYRTLNGLFYFFYFVLGAVVALHLPKWKHFVAKSLSWNVFLFVLLYVWVGYELVAGSPSRINLNYSTSLKISMFLFTVSHLILLYAYAAKVSELKSRAYRLLTLLGQYSFGAYLAHALIISIVFRATARFAFLQNQNDVFLSVIMLLAVSSLSFAVTFLLSKIPYAKLFIGSFPARRSAGVPQSPDAKGGVQAHS